MLVEFRVENHRSIREEQAFSMEASSSSKISASSHSRRVEGHKQNILPVAAIYGANGSGKSNFLHALSFMQQAVIQSHVHWEAGAKIPRSPFAWWDGPSDDSLYEATFITNGIKYVYGFVVNDESFVEEWLYAYPKGFRQVWFERELTADGYQFKFGDFFHGRNKFLESLTRPNALFVSVAAQNQHELILPVYEWFWRIYTISLSHQKHHIVRSSGRKLLESDPSLSRAFMLLLRAADLGVIGFEFDDSVRGTGPLSRHQGIRLLHQGGTDNLPNWLPLAEESSGTQCLFDRGVTFLHALKNSGVLLVDEIEKDLHPYVAAAIVRLFLSVHSNPGLAQLIFSTHDTNLLGARGDDGHILARDQVWLTEKSSQGSTTIYPLTDYKPRKSESIERGYLSGRYGAVPFIGDFENIPVLG
jgi:hypothetical protein